MNRIVRPVDAGDLLVEEDWKGRTIAAGLSDMVGVIKPNREELGWTPKIPLEQTIDDLLEFWRARVRPA